MEQEEKELLFMCTQRSYIFSPKIIKEYITLVESIFFKCVFLK